MRDWITTAIIIALTLLSAAGGVLAVRRLGAPAEQMPKLNRLRRAVTVGVTLGVLLLFVYRWAAVWHRWMPLEAHVDGLLLIVLLLTPTLWFIEKRTKLAGLGLVTWPLLTLLLAWAVCASAWTFRPFNITTIWLTLHLAAVYLGGLCVVLAAGSGGLYLMVNRALRRKRDPAEVRKLGTLETTEKWMIRWAAAGFALITLGLASGLILVVSKSSTGSEGWLVGKIVLGGVVWVAYGLVMNVRHQARFRGAQAAMISIAGLVLLLAVMAFSVRPHSTAAPMADHADGTAPPSLSVPPDAPVVPPPPAQEAP